MLDKEVRERVEAILRDVAIDDEDRVAAGEPAIEDADFLVNDIRALLAQSARADHSPDGDFTENVGRESWAKGRTIDENPYLPGTLSFYAWRSGWRAGLEAERDALRVRADELERRLGEAREERDNFKTALHDLVMLNAQDEIGCVPAPTRKQWASAWAEAEELVRVEP